MRLTVLHMLSTNSLQAFSSATTTPVGRAGGTDAIRLVRAQPDQVAARQASPTTSAIPDARPGLPPPRGSLLNLSV